jgi:hypothetical protein
MRFAMIANAKTPGLFATCLNWCAIACTPDMAPETPDTAPETDRDRRDFVLGMMDDHPHAFTSEADVQCMMHLYPGRF